MKSYQQVQEEWVVEAIHNAIETFTRGYLSGNYTLHILNYLADRLDTLRWHYEGML